MERLIVTARVHAVSGALSSDAISAGGKDLGWTEPDCILLATDTVGEGEPHATAAEVLLAHGIAGIIAPRFAWPFFRVCLAIGLPPLTVWEAGEMQTGDRLRIDVHNRVVKAMSAGTRYPIRDLSDLYVDILAAGGLEGYVRAKLEETGQCPNA